MHVPKVPIASDDPFAVGELVRCARIRLDSKCLCLNVLVRLEYFLANHPVVSVVDCMLLERNSHNVCGVFL